MKDEDRSSVYAFTKKCLWSRARAEKEGTEEFWGNWHNGNFNAKVGEGSYLLASVFDGFQGSYSAELINRTLHACIAYALEQAGHPRDFVRVCKVVNDV